ncbi:deoxyribonuclease V [Fodinibius salsisoli]|uniref:Endonuclease V n=1 Tax=Fodinibius salsisoli TaxID=2820877 RepID=A0ABT3PNC3_9BACT|nr:deoxyribonuclease V [Fodinibius salsisoli]MCW9707398.1 deoxyribonuclease V [Fodinibius salsisoli]
MNPLEYYKTIKPVEAKKVQQQLRQKISLEPFDGDPEYVAGADISFNRGSDMMHAAIIVLRLPDLQPVAHSLVSEETPFPYIPGLLAFRELPVLWKAWQQLQLKPDVLIMDGHGLAHPRRMGIATHFGIEIDWPTMGCAKNILTGSHDELAAKKGASVALMDGDEQVGLTLRSRTNVNPVYISPGHKVSFDDTYKIAMKTLTKYKLPRTTRLAHKWANRLRRGEAEEGYVEQ